MLSSLKGSDLPIMLTNKQNGDLSLINEKTFFLNSDFSTEGIIAAQYIVTHLGLESIAIIAPAYKNIEIHSWYRTRFKNVFTDITVLVGGFSR